ncbi:LacI family DNA-binding transcriptional regulator [Catalinimonas niigatensis]|uniref:LacI family DNA-binding transcriptional regulator n=1 Tax=Catalinimonas niigatensis TaxID=1397264 RepID=UPI002666A1B7|nr:substrate-binding domain-containing protein [Catalinimonas niigatensis]WPP50973.1 substrate-binding domain-containing protein [Catalinimonas niigatensis]
MEKGEDEATIGVKEIARRANVSIATVDRVIHNRTGVAENTRKKIQQIIKDIDYQPNLLASRLASKKVYSLAVLIPEVSNETDYWEAPLNGIQRAESEIGKYGIKTKIYLFDLNSRASFIQQTERVMADKVDGVLLAPSFIEESTYFTYRCKERKIPYVFINSDIPNQDSLCYIGPDLMKSGYLAGHLMSYGIGEQGKVLVVNISKEMDNHHHLLRKEEGFRKYFEDHQRANEIVKVDVRQTEYTALEETLAEVFSIHPDIKAIFTTNSRISSVARFVEKSAKEKLLLIGYDFLKENIEYLKKETIDFLICQKPEEQAYRGMMTLYQHLMLASEVEKVHYMPIDIITKENYTFYSN